jgi:hypothetical protein
MVYSEHFGKRRSNTWRVIFGILVALLVLGLGFFAWTKRASRQEPIKNSLLLNTESPSSESQNTGGTEDWWTYTSPDLQFQLRYPRNITAETRDEGVYFQNADKTTVAAVFYQSRATDERLTVWHNTQAVGEAKLGGFSAKRFLYEAAAETVAVVIERPGTFLAFEFYGDKTLDAIEQAMLDSFAFRNLNLTD